MRLEYSINSQDIPNATVIKQKKKSLLLPKPCMGGTETHINFCILAKVLATANLQVQY